MVVQTPLIISELAGQEVTQDFKSTLTYYPVEQAPQVVFVAQVVQLAIEQLMTVYNYLLLLVVLFVDDELVSVVAEAVAAAQAKSEFGHTVLLQGIPKAFEKAEHVDLI